MRTGFINAERIAQHFPRGAGDTTPSDAMVLVCGPPPFMNVRLGGGVCVDRVGVWEGGSIGETE